MAERKAVNKYYPPDWDPRKGSVNKRVGQHPLRDRAKKLGQGILVIRFELPYNIWCGGCGSHVGMGVRYNAEKSKVGNYYSTPIYKFRMKCHLCDNYFEIQTDPKNHDYVILCGARRKEQRWDPVANEQIVPEDKAIQKKMSMDAMYKLEHGSDDKTRGKDKAKNLAELESSRFSMKEDYLLNRMARDKFRAEKKQLKEAAEAERSIVERGALDIELLEETEEDRNLADLLKYSVTTTYEEKQKEKRKSIEQRPLFNGPKPSSINSLDALSLPSSSYKSSDNQESNEDTKQKLSETLRLSHKDPFAITKSMKIFGTSSSKPSTFGIRLKHSRVLKGRKIKSSLSKKAVISHLHADPSDTFIKKTKDNKADHAPSTGSTSNVVSNLGSMLSPHNQLDNISNSRQTESSTGISDKQFQILTSTVIAVNNNTKTPSESTDKTSMSASEECDSPSVSIQDKSHSSLGLSILMSSYDDDQDSDSCGSS